MPVPTLSDARSSALLATKLPLERLSTKRREWKSSTSTRSSPSSLRSTPISSPGCIPISQSHEFAPRQFTTKFGPHAPIFLNRSSPSPKSLRSFNSPNASLDSRDNSLPNSPPNLSNGSATSISDCTNFTNFGAAELLSPRAPPRDHGSQRPRDFFRTISSEQKRLIPQDPSPSAPVEWRTPAQKLPPRITYTEEKEMNCVYRWLQAGLKNTIAGKMLFACQEYSRSSAIAREPEMPQSLTMRLHERTVAPQFDYMVKSQMVLPSVHTREGFPSLMAVSTPCRHGAKGCTRLQGYRYSASEYWN